MTTFDVVAVEMKSLRVRLIAEGKSERAAEGIVNMAVMRRGVEVEFFAEVPAGSYSDGDLW